MERSRIEANTCNDCTNDTAIKVTIRKGSNAGANTAKRTKEQKWRDMAEHDDSGSAGPIPIGNGFLGMG